MVTDLNQDAERDNSNPKISNETFMSSFLQKKNYIAVSSSLFFTQLKPWCFKAEQ